MSVKQRWIAIVLSLSACCAAGPCAADAPSTPPKVLVFPADVKVFSLTASGNIEDAPDATAAASGYGNTELQRYVASDPAFKALSMPSLSGDEQATLKEHVALYKTIVRDAHFADAVGDAWKVPLQAFTYSVGPGLDFLRQRSGADYLLLLTAEDGESTGGRMAMTFLFGGPIGRNYISAGLIDLHSGKVVWLNYDTHNASDYNVQANMTKFVDEILEDFPSGSLHDAPFAATDAH